MTGRSPHRTRPAATAGRLVLGPGLGMYIGPLLDNDIHAHHAVQVSVALETTLRLQTGASAPWRKCSAALTAPDRPHRMESRGVLAQVYVDPESTVGRRLRGRLNGKALEVIPWSVYTPIRQRLQACWRERRSDADWAQAIDEVLDHLVPDDAPPPRDRRVVRALDILHDAASGGPRRLATLAAEVSLSPSRFAHLFRACTGLPVRRYALWLRLIHAVRLIAGGTSLTTAAHEAAFADSAHLTRTFRRMFGMPPSVLRSIGTVLRSGAPPREGGDCR